MLISRVAYRFAKALLSFAIERNELDKVIKSVQVVDQTYAESRDLRVMLASPIIKNDKKAKAFNKVFDGHLDVITAKFFEIVFRRRREELIGDITQSFIEQYKDYKHIHTITVETASPLSEANRKEVMEFLKKKTSEEIELVEEIREDLIGGIVIKMKDMQIDASVKNNLSKLARDFSKDIYSAKL